MCQHEVTSAGRSTRQLLIVTIVIAAVGAVHLAAGARSASNSDWFTKAWSEERDVDMYWFNETQYSASPARMYLFRRNASVSGDPLPNQRPILVSRAALRQIVIVVVPENVAAPIVELKTEDEVLATSYDRQIVGGLFCACPIKPDNFTYAAQTDSILFPGVSAFVENGLETTYIDYGTTPTAILRPIYKVMNSNQEVLNYLVEDIPNDGNYSTMRQVYTVTSLTEIKKIADLPTVRIATTQNVFAPVVSVTGADVVAEVFPRNRGYYRGREVYYYEFNASRVRGSIGQKDRVGTNTLYVFGDKAWDEATPVATYVPGDPLYSDLWEVVNVTATNASVDITQLTSAALILAEPSVVLEAAGLYLNCPIVNSLSELQHPDDNARIRKLPVSYKGSLRYCFNFGFVDGCGTQLVYELTRPDNKVVAGNDLFSAAPITDRGYTAMSWMVKYSVSATYASGTMTSDRVLPDAASLDTSVGRYANRPIVAMASTATASHTYRYSTILSSRRESFLGMEWDLKPNVMHVRLTVHYSIGSVALGFSNNLDSNVTTVSGHDGFFAVFYVDDSSRICTRQVVGQSTNWADMAEPTGNILNITDVSVERFANGTSFITFTRGLAPSLAYPNATLDVNGYTRVLYAMKRTVVPTCFVSLSELKHGELFGSKVLPLDPDLQRTEAPLTAAPATPVPFVLPDTPAPGMTYPPNFVGNGTYRFDSKLAMSWLINTSTAEIDISLDVVNHDGWVGFGVGFQMAGADIFTAYRDAEGTVVVDDRKGITQTLPPRDMEQNVASVGNTYTFRRKLDTGDTHDSTQPVASTNLKSESLRRREGFAENKPYAFYEFSNTPQYGTSQQTATAPFYRFVNASGAPMTFQRDLIDIVPGQIGYSDLWSVTEIQVPANFNGPEITWHHSIPSTWARTRVDKILNCPVVHQLTNIDPRDINGEFFASGAARYNEIWYRGRLYRCIEFFYNTYNSTAVQKAYRVRSTTTNSTVSVVFEQPLSSANYTPFVWVYDAWAPGSTDQFTYKNVTSLLSQGFNITEVGLHRNMPMVIELNVTAPTTTAVPQEASSIDPALLAKYQYSQVLFTEKVTQESVTLYWNYYSAQNFLQVLAVGMNLKGYIAIGFSSGSYRGMNQADIVLGYVNTIDPSGCVRTMYSERETGAPSGVATMIVSNPRVFLAGDATLLEFERDFIANAHPAGVVPTPAEGGKSRIVYASLRGTTLANCSVDDFSHFYHGNSPRGSVIVDWLPSNETQAPSANNTQAPQVFTLIPETLSRQEVHYRGRQTNMYCLNNPLPTLTTYDRADPVMYVFRHGTTFDSPVVDGQSPVINAFPTTANYTDLWRIKIVNVRLGDTNVLRSATQIPSSSISEDASLYVNCPVVHESTTVAAEDQASFPKMTVWYEGAQFFCMRMTEYFTNAPRVGRVWNDTARTLIDDLEPWVSLKSIVNINTANSPVGDPSELGDTIQVPTNNIRNCVPVTAFAEDAFVEPPTKGYTLETGWVDDRKVSFFYVEVTNVKDRFGSKVGGIRRNKIYSLHYGTSLYNDQLQTSMIIEYLPGHPLYSDLYDVIVVEIPVSVAQGTTFTSVADLADFTKHTTSVAFNCPIVHSQSEFAGNLVSLLTVYNAGTNVTCANFGYSSAPDSLTTMYSMENSAGAALSQHVFASAPGSGAFSSFVWMVGTQFDSTVAVDSVKSVNTINTIQNTQVERYRIWNCYVISVDQGSPFIANEVLVMKTALWSVDRRELKYLERTNPITYSFAGPVAHTIDQYRTSTNGTRLSFSKVYVFRRGLQYDGDVVVGQASILQYAPGEFRYSNTEGGSIGYTELKEVVVVKVPVNYTDAEITSEATLLSTFGPRWDMNQSTGVYINMAVGATYTFPNDTRVCEQIKVNHNFKKYDALDCGIQYHKKAMDMTTLNNGTVVFEHLPSNTSEYSNLVNADGRFDVFNAVAVLSDNPQLVENVILTEKKGYYERRAVELLQLGTVGSDEFSSMRKFVFRRGRSLYSNNGIDVLQPVLEFGPTDTGHSDVVRILVVDVSASDVVNFSIMSLSEMFAAVRQHCWTITDSGLYEIGFLLPSQVTYTSSVELTYASVFYNGNRGRHYVFGRYSLTELTTDNANNIAVEVIDTNTSLVSHFVFSREPSEGDIPRRNLRATRTSNPSTIRSFLDAERNGLEEEERNRVLMLVTSKIDLNPPGIELLPMNLTRHLGWFESRQVFYYMFNNTRSYSAAINAIPMYVFRRGTTLDSQTLIGSPPLIDRLPGHDGYSDLHELYVVRVPTDYSQIVPTNMRDLNKELRSGRLTVYSTGQVKNTIIVHRDTTFAEDNRVVFKETVNYEGGEHAALDFGFVPASGADTNQIFMLFRGNSSDAESDRVLENDIFNTIPDILAPFAPEAHPFRRVIQAVVSLAYIDDQIRNVTGIRDLTNVATDEYINAPIVTVDSPLPQLFFDDIPISTGQTKIIWAYGPLNRNPYELLPHASTGRGIASIDFFTGVTDQDLTPTAVPVGLRTVQLDTSIVLQWVLNEQTDVGIVSSPSGEFSFPPLATPVPARNRRDFLTVSESEIIFTVTVTLDRWVALSLVPPGGIGKRDVMLMYHTEREEGQIRVVSEPYTRLSDRHMADDTFLNMEADEMQNLYLREAHLLSGQPGYSLTFARPLRSPDIVDDLDIDAHDIVVRWAYGAWDATKNEPSEPMKRGSAVIDFVTGNLPAVRRTRNRLWEVGVLVVVIFATFAIALALRSTSPGHLLFTRPFVTPHRSAYTFVGWFTDMTYGELLLFILFIGMWVVWMIANWINYTDNKFDHVEWRTLGTGLQFLLYFSLFPVVRYNPVLRCFGTDFLRVNNWHQIINVLFLAFGWVHGIGMMSQNKQDAWTFDVGNVAGVPGLLAIIFATFQFLGTFTRWSRFRRWYLLHVLNGVSILLFVLLHQPKTGYGLIPILCFMLLDYFMRWKSRMSRRGRIRSYQTFGRDVVGMEIEISSPWHEMLTRQFEAEPGQFVYIQLYGSAALHPFSISSKVTQGQEAQVASFTIHVKKHSSKRSVKHNTFTNWVFELAESKELSDTPIKIEGPYGGMKTRLKWYNTLLLVAGGIGITPIMSILETLAYVPDYFSQRTKIRHVTLVWIVSKAEEFGVFANELAAIVESTPKFSFQIIPYESGSASKTPKIDAPEILREDDVAIGFPPRRPSPNPEDSDDNLPQVYNAEADLSSSPVQKAPRLVESSHRLFQQFPITHGRPNWGDLFSAVRLNASKRGERRVAVYSSGPEGLQLDVQRACDVYGDRRYMQFHLHRESFMV